MPVRNGHHGYGGVSKALLASLFLIPLSGLALLLSGEDDWLPLHVAAHVIFFVVAPDRSQRSPRALPALARRLPDENRTPKGQPVSPTHRRLRATVSGLVLGLAASALTLAPGALPAAQGATGGGSIVYVKDFNVWITDGDGSVQRQVTTGGTAADPWQSPTQSDAGVVVAHHSGLIYRMNQRGEVFNTIDPPALPDTLGNRLEGRDLTETAISPDGSKIAYTYFKFSYGEKRWTTAFTDAGGLSDPQQWGLAFYDKPSWVTNSRVVLNHWYRNKTHLYDLGQRDTAWFDERFYANPAKELSDLEVSRDGRWVVGVRGDVGDQSVVVLPTGGDVLTSTSPWTPTPSTRWCDISLADGDVHEPTVAPDGSTLAWAEPTGIYRSSDMDCDDETRFDVLVAAGGSDPSWSAAAVGQTPDVPKAQPQHLTVSKAAAVAGRARVGKVLTVKPGSWVPAPTTVTIRWTRDGKPIKKATKARYRVTRKDRGHKIAAQVVATREGWLPTITVTKAVKVRR
ncbi:hypothetical protein G5V58_10040 [Nocardioides anomalus]|uniref:WD40 repeat domain-containing protein n=1 Tax=Nocardioides anomalus TaxID=2712223 RepID=A0A6G6WCU9_9ACTN|nr:PD40 domain-containing protein [Nocardioides anomalus]QIG43054.1 hypothetical protein G5V58_10040 [Nocardioides anomalus]